MIYPIPPYWTVRVLFLGCSSLTEGPTLYPIHFKALPLLIYLHIPNNAERIHSFTLPLTLYNTIFAHIKDILLQVRGTLLCHHRNTVHSLEIHQ